MIKPQTWWPRLADFVSQEERGTTLALVRISVGLCLLLSLSTMLIDGVIEPLFVSAKHGGVHVLSTKYKPWLLKWMGGNTPFNVWLLYAWSLAGAIAVTVGFGGRWACLLTLLPFFALFGSSGKASGASDLLMANGLWLLFLGQPTATLSVDCFRKHKRWSSDALVRVWPRYLLAFQLIVVYTLTGIQKTHVAWGWNGDYAALYYILQEPIWARFDCSELCVTLFPVTQIGTWTTWVFEAFFFLMIPILWWRRTADRGGRIRRVFNRFDIRYGVVLFGIALHAGIAMTMQVGVFSYIILGFYWSLFNAEENQGNLEAIGARLARIRARFSRESGQAS